MSVRVSTTVSASCERGKVRNSKYSVVRSTRVMVALLEFFLMIRSPFLMAWDEVPFGLLGPIGDPGALDPRLA